MTLPDPAAAERQLLATTAALLEAGQGIDALSRPLAVLAFAGLLASILAPVPIASLCALVLAGLAGLATAYAGIRVALDQALFRGLVDGTGSLALLDESLTMLGIVPARKAGRPLSERVAGATRLLRRQATLFAIQAAALLAAGAAGALHSWTR